MWGPARLVALLAVAAATNVAAASDRFVPNDPGFVVANVRQALPDESLRPLLLAWRANPGGSAESIALATAYMERARALREPAYFGRAEAVIEPLASRPAGSAPVRRLYAELLQHRHEFAAAEAILDALLQESAHDLDARLLRASVRLVRGDFPGARTDCAHLASTGGTSATAGFACLAEALAGSGQLERALALLDAEPMERAAADAAARAYLLATRAELRERSGDTDGAIVDYAEALKLAPRDDAIRAALADVLSAHAHVEEAQELLAIDKPSLGLVVRSAALTAGPRRVELSARAAAWLELEAARGDAVHYREEAMLALSQGNATHALSAAARNFEAQKELADVRVLARAARAARDAGALESLREWMRQTGYRDSVTESILGDGGRS